MKKNNNPGRTENNKVINPRQCKIALTYIPNTYNYGSMMMAENLIYYLKNKMSEIIFYTDASTDDDLERLINATKVNNICKLEKIGYVKNSKSINYNKIIRQFIWAKETIQLPLILKNNNIESLIMLGGDNISEYYGSGFGITKILIELYSFANKGIKVFLPGQTIGPFTSWRVPIAKKLLRNDNIYIYTRDPKSYRYLKNYLKITNVQDCADLAFLDLPLQRNDKNIDDILRKYSLKNGEYITLVPSGLWKKYCENREAYIQAWCDILQWLSKNEYTKEYKIVLLPHVLKPDLADDRHIIKEIEKRVDVKNMVPIYDAMLPYQARHILGSGYFTITGRMHGAVSTFQMGKPAISLSYAVKYSGVIGEGLKRNDLIIEANDTSLYSKNLLPALVEEKVNYVIENYEHLVKEIRAETKKQKEKAIKQIDDIAEKIQGG